MGGRDFCFCFLFLDELGRPEQPYGDELDGSNKQRHISGIAAHETKTL